MAIAFACSPPIRTSAVCTGPHVKPSTNGRHSTTGAPPAPVCCGSGSVIALDRMRKPIDPVSTRMPPIVWQLDVPGTHTVTDTNGWLGALLAGPLLTEIGSTLDAVGAGAGVVDPLDGVVGDEPVSPHCGVDTCARISSAPANIRRGTRYFTTPGAMPAGINAATYATPDTDRPWPDA